MIYCDLMLSATLACFSAFVIMIKITGIITGEPMHTASKQWHHVLQLHLKRRCFDVGYVQLVIQQ